VTGVTASLTILRFGSGLATLIDGMITQSFIGLEFSRAFSWLVRTTFSLAVAADTVMAIAMVVCLHQRKTGHKRTNSIVDVLMVYTINTGLATSCVTIAGLIFAIVAPDNLIYLALYSVLGKFQANSVLAVFIKFTEIISRPRRRVF